jgi:hypothetical protein
MLQYITAPSEALAPTVENAHLLQQSADHRSATRLLSASGRWSIVWGALCILAAAAIFRSGILIPTALLAIGCILLGVGLWLVIAPSPLGMLADGIAMIGFSALNLWTYVHNLHRSRVVFGGSSSSWWILLFVITFLTGIQRIVRFRRFSRVKSSQPSPGTRKWIDEVYREMRLLTPSRDESMIKIEAATFPPIVFKAQLGEEMAICMANTRLLFIPKKDLSIVPLSSGKKKIKVEVTLPEKKFKGQMLATLYDRYRAWKGDEEASEEAVVLEEDPS